ncbi:hypothetical protein ACIGD1_11370 [Streptomyces sp. NPDC085612]|uniref:hypothetical protein n=1 Tax=Streptomyces sp. NPDC085612 TaxID=3365732 RepID=UPI0037D91382
MTEPASIEEQLARLIAATDWVEDPADDAWWRSCRTDFRDQYLAYAQQIITMVRAHDGSSR